MLRVAVCGEGPIALSIAAICGWRGHLVRVLSDRPQRWRQFISGRLPDGGSFAGPLELVTADALAVVSRADIVFVCARHYEVEDILARVAPHVRPETLIGAIPGFGGFGLIARRVMPEVVCFFGTQRIPFDVAGQVPGRSVFISGIRRQTFVATMPAGCALTTADLLRALLGAPTVPVSHFVNIELSPSNSLVNPARLYSLFGPRARRVPRRGEEFFLGWDAPATRTLVELDRELQLGRGLIPRDTSFVAPILLQYDSNDAATLTMRFRRLHSLAGRPVPLRSRGAGDALDPRSDYVREDIDFGLVLMRDVLRLAGARTPLMDEIIEWRQRYVGSNRSWARVMQRVPTRSFTTIHALVSALD
jgi:hypothetical protein